VATLKTGFGSDGLIYDPSRKLLFVPAPKEATLVVVALTDGKPKIVQRVTSGSGARLGALDPNSGLIYLPSAKLGPPVPPDPYPTVIPGTFKFIVVGEAAEH
jgi:hypothetical protein